MNVFAAARPMPLLPPVMTATFPANFCIVNCFVVELIPNGFFRAESDVLGAAKISQYHVACRAMPFRHNGSRAMELRHLRYFVTFALPPTFTKPPTKLLAA